MEKFKLKEGEEYIELNNLLKVLNWTPSGGEAKMRIKNDEVLVNGVVETRVRKKLRSMDKIQFGPNEALIE